MNLNIMAKQLSCALSHHYLLFKTAQRIPRYAAFNSQLYSILNLVLSQLYAVFKTPDGSTQSK